MALSIFKLWRVGIDCLVLPLDLIGKKIMWS